MCRETAKSVPKIPAFSATLGFIWNKMGRLYNARLVRNSTAGYAHQMDFAKNAFLAFTRQAMTLANPAPPKIAKPAMHKCASTAFLATISTPTPVRPAQSVAVLPATVTASAPNACKDTT